MITQYHGEIHSPHLFSLVPEICEELGSPGDRFDVTVDASSGNPNDAYDDEPGWRPRNDDVRACILHHQIT
jgi:hypothetical protein